MNNVVQLQDHVPTFMRDSGYEASRAMNYLLVTVFLP